MSQRWVWAAGMAVAGLCCITATTEGQFFRRLIVGSSPQRPFYSNNMSRLPRYPDAATHHGIAANHPAEPPSDGPKTDEKSTNAAVVKVRVPAADAKIWFGNHLTRQTGIERTYYSPALVPGYKYVYEVRATWLIRGRAFSYQRRVTVAPGGTATVDFTQPVGRQNSTRTARADSGSLR
jgi:uncharacterized protein (TIGR03000 family)